MEPNSQLGNYTLEARLGSGATADVFRAIQTSVERTVAIKVMHSHLAHSDDFAVRFQREAKAMGQLQHPHIARVIDYDATDAHPYMVIEYLPGGSLRDHLDGRVGPLSVAESVAICRQLADALHYAHRMGMVHRDIKPANVMFVDEARRHAVLTDFGIARLADDAMTATGTVLGTPAYIAPEQVRGERADAAADQYSLGIMLFEMVTGERPFDADSPHALMMMHIIDPVPSAAARNPLVPRALDDIIQRALAKQPAARFGDAHEMMQALDAVAGGSEPAPRIAPVDRGAQTIVANAVPPTVAPGAGSRGRLIGAAVVVLALVAVGVFALTQLGGDDEPVDTVSVADTADTADAGDTAEPEASEVASTPLAPEATATPATATPATAPQADAPSQTELPTFDVDAPPPLFVTNAMVVGDRLLVGFDRVRAPSAGTSYVAWIDGVDGPVGELVIDDRGQARLETALPDLVTARSFMVTEEPDGASATSPTGTVVFTAGIDNADTAAPGRVLVALEAAERELTIGRDHDLLMRDEIAAGDLDQVRRHAEHVVNILDGSVGDDFGDLDGNGLAENPGDDIGVRGHFLELAAMLSDDAAAVDLDQIRDRTSAQLNDAQREFFRVIAVDSVGEIDVTAGTLALDAITVDLAQARSLLLGSFATDLVSDVPASSALGGIAWLAPSGDELEIRSGLAGFPGANEGSGVSFFAHVGGADGAVRVVELDELHAAAVPIDAAESTSLSELVVAIERRVGDGESEIIARLIPAVEAAVVLETMRGAEGSLAQLEAQAQLVIDHTDLMQQAIDAGDMAELRRHAEHVVNLTEGAAGEHFGDLDGDGTAQNPGDDVGVLAYLAGLQSTAQTLPITTDEQAFYNAIWIAALETIHVQALDVADQALRVFAADSPGEAQPLVTQAFDAGVRMVDGFDVDENGVVDLFAGELGVRGLSRQAPTLVVARLVLEDGPR